MCVCHSNNSEKFDFAKDENIKRRVKERRSLKYTCREFKRGFAPLKEKIPLPLNKGEGDKGDRVNK
jgi:hypothetical protein